MNDPLAEILRRTDAMSEAPGVAADMAGRVRRVHRRRRMLRTGAAIVTVITLALTATSLMQSRPHPTLAVISAPPIEDIRAIEADAKLHQMIADLLEKHERESQPASTMAADEYLWNLSQQTNRAALILVHSGDVMNARFHDRAAALGDYEAAIKKFPHSPAAAIAQARIGTIEHKGNES